MKNIAAKMLEVEKEISYLQKDKNSNLKYSFISHDKVTEAIRPLMVKHGVYYYVNQVDCNHQTLQDRNGNPVIFTTVEVTVTFVDTDSGEWLSMGGFGTGLDPSDKSVGKAISYAVKYVLLKSLGLATGDDPEQDNIEIGVKNVSGNAGDGGNDSVPMRTGTASSSGISTVAASAGKPEYIEGKHQRFIWSWSTSAAPAGLGMERLQVENVLREMGFVDDSGKPKISIVPMNRFEDLKNTLTLRASG